MKKYLILIAAVIMQMCLGATYSWAVFIMPLKETTHLGQGALQLPFTLFYFIFPLTLIFSNRVLRLLGPTPASVLGGIIFGSGWIFAGLGSDNFVFVSLGIGLFAGVGVGMVYLVPVTVGLAWFPERKGLVTGITVAGFGGGAALISQIAGFGMEKLGYTPFQMFRILGFCFAMLIVLTGLLMKNPPEFRLKRIKPVDYRSFIKNKAFQLLFLAMFTGLAAGLSINANMKELNVALDVKTGLHAVAVFAIANALGRVFWGFISDRMQISRSIQLNLISQSVVILSGFFLLRSSTGFLVFAFLTGLNYGGILVLYASAVARIWGTEHVSQIYGLLFSVHLLATFAPMASGYAYDYLGSFTLPFIFLALLMLIVAFIIQKINLK